MAFLDRVLSAARQVRRQAPGLRVSYVVSAGDRRLPHARAAFLVSSVTGCGHSAASRLLREDEADAAAAMLREREREHAAEGTGIALGSLAPDEGRILYALVRARRPRLVVETGVASGSSSLFLLAALERNRTGCLVSIDLPFSGLDRLPHVPNTAIGEWDASPLPPGREPGWIVPMALRGRWDLRLGDAKVLLPALEGPAGMFLHDSLHTREHMLFEFREAWRLLEQGGVLAADDVFQRRHDALPAFARSVSRRFRTYMHLGFIVR